MQLLYTITCFLLSYQGALGKICPGWEWHNPIAEWGAISIYKNGVKRVKKVRLNWPSPPLIFLNGLIWYGLKKIRLPVSTGIVSLYLYACIFFLNTRTWKFFAPENFGTVFGFWISLNLSIFFKWTSTSPESPWPRGKRLPSGGRRLVHRAKPTTDCSSLEWNFSLFRSQGRVRDVGWPPAPRPGGARQRRVSDQIRLILSDTDESSIRTLIDNVGTSGTPTPGSAAGSCPEKDSQRRADHASDTNTGTNSNQLSSIPRGSATGSGTGDQPGSAPQGSSIGSQPGRAQKGRATGREQKAVVSVKLLNDSNTNHPSHENKA